MRRTTPLTFGAGVLVGAAGVVAALVLVTRPPLPLEPVAHPSAPSSPRATPEPRAAVAPGGGGDETPEEPGAIVRWLSERLQEAYRIEALPEIIGQEAGADAADQVYDYITEADDTDLVRDLLEDVIDRPPEDLGLEGWSLDSKLDCSTAPCLLRVDLTREDGTTAGCPAARSALTQQLKDALQPGHVTTEGEHTDALCRLKAVALSAAARGRQEEIDAGIEGFIDNYFGPAKERLDALE